jgi:hypothetical protein
MRVRGMFGIGWWGRWRRYGRLVSPRSARRHAGALKPCAPGLDRTDAVGLDMAYPGSDPPGTVSSNPSSSCTESAKHRFLSCGAVAQFARVFGRRMKVGYDRGLTGADAPDRLIEEWWVMPWAGARHSHPASRLSRRSAPQLGGHTS